MSAPVENKKSSKSGIGTGSVSLILIFAVLCLTIFALLTLSSAKAENDLAAKTAASISAYYAADAQAEHVFSALRSAMTTNDAIPATIDDIAITANEEGSSSHIAYFVPMDDAQQLSVILSYDQASASFDILKWQIELASEWEAVDDFNVWLD